MSQRLRALVGDGGIHVLPGVYNAITAKIAESAGFEAVGVSGYGVSASLIGQPDIGLTTCSEIVMVSGYVVDAVNVPVIADADTGFGNAINTMRTTEQFIKAGVAGIHIEDQVAPKRCGHVAGKEIIPLEEAVGKYRAAVKVGVIFADAKNKAGAKDFVSFLMQEENLTPYVEGALGRWFPVTKAGQASPFWQADRHRKSVFNQYAAGTVMFEFTRNYKFTVLNNENVWAKAMNRVVNEKIPVDKAVDEMIARIKTVAG